MAIPTNGLQLVRLAGAVFGQQLSATDYSEILTANKSVAELNSWANSATAAEFKGKTTTDIAKAVLANLGLTQPGLEAWLAGQLTAGGGVAKAGETMLGLLNDYSNMTADATFGASATTFNTKAAASQALSLTAGTATGTYAAVSSVVVNTALTLTSAVQTSTGTAGDDTFTAAAGTLNTGDVINGGAGTDTLNATITGTGPTQSATSLVGIEVLNLTPSPNPTTLDLTGVTGLTQVNNVSPANGATLTVTGLGNVVNTTITGGNTSTTLTYATAAVASTTADAMTVSLKGTAAGSGFTTSGIETLTINSGTSANTLSTLSAVGMTKLVVTGDQALTIGGTTGNSGSSSVIGTTTFDLSAATGALTLTTGNGTGGTGSVVGATVIGPTAATAGALTLTTGSATGSLNDTVTLGAGTNTVTTNSGNDTITSGGGTNTITPGTGNDTINAGAGVDTIRLADTGATAADTINAFGATDVISINIGAAAVTGASATAASPNAAFGVVPTGATSPVLQNVAGSATTNAVVFQAVAPNATATVGTVAGTSNVIALNGAYTDGTAAGVLSALGTTKDAGIATSTIGKFLLVTYSVGNIAQVWSYAGDTTTANSDIDSGELALVATLNGVALNGLTAANFSTYLTPVAASTTVSNAGQTINLTGTLNTVLSTANTAGQFLTAGADTINVGVGTLPLNAASSSSGMTLIDPTAGDSDVLNATNLSATSFSGGATLTSNIETINLNMLVANDTFSAAARTPGTNTFGLTGTQNFTVTGMPAAGGVTLDSGYTGQANYQLISATGTADTFTVNLNGSTATSATVGASAIYTAGGLGNIETTVVNVNAASSIRLAGAGLLGTVAESPTINLVGASSLTVFGTATNLNTAALAGGRDAYTGALTLRPTDDQASMDFSDGGVITGIRTIDLQDIPTYGTVAGRTITFNASNTTNGILSATISNSPSATATQGAITVAIPNGGSTSDAVTFSLGSKVTTIGAIDARGVESVTVSTSVTAGSSFAIGNIQLTDGAGSQTVTVTGAANIGGTSTITADTVNYSGVTGTVTGLTLANTGGVAFTGGSGATTVIGSANADSITTAANSVNTNTITSAAGNDVINLGANHTGVVKIVFSGGTTNANTLAANGADYITGFATTDTINIAGLGNQALAALTGTLSAAAAKADIADGAVYILNVAGTAAALGTGGAAVVTDYTNMTQVAAFLNDRFSHTANTADIEGVFVWNVGRTSYVYNLDTLNTANTTIDANEVSLVGTIIQTAALTSSNLVYA